MLIRSELQTSKTREVVVKVFHTVVVAVALLTVVSGVAVAEPIMLSNVSESVDTDDGWHLSASLTDMTINSVPNMAATAFTREGFVTATARESIVGRSANALVSGFLFLWLDLGCQINVPDGLTLNPNPSAGFAPQVGINSPTGSAPSGSIDIGAGQNESANPQTSVTLKPGSITPVNIGRKAFKNEPVKESNGDQFLVISVHNRHVNVDGCAGPVSVRLRAQAQIGTTRSDHNVNAYSDILSL